MEAKKSKSKLKPEFKVCGDFLDLRHTNTNVLISYLEDQMRLRETPVEKRLKKAQFITKQ